MEIKYQRKYELKCNLMDDSVLITLPLTINEFIALYAIFHFEIRTVKYFEEINLDISSSYYLLSIIS